MRRNGENNAHRRRRRRKRIWRIMAKPAWLMKSVSLEGEEAAAVSALSAVSLS